MKYERTVRLILSQRVELSQSRNQWWTGEGCLASGSEFKCKPASKDESIPWYFSTRVRKRYPMIFPILLDGTTQAPSHFDVASSTTAQMGKPMLYSLSWPSPAQRSLMPTGFLAMRRIFLAPGSRWSKPLASNSCITSEIKSLVRWMPRNARHALILSSPWLPETSLSSSSMINCTLSWWGILRVVTLLPYKLRSRRRRLTVPGLSVYCHGE